MQEIVQNSKFEILSPEGWVDFDGMKVSTHNVSVQITLDDDSLFRTSLDHKIQTQSHGMVEAHFLEKDVVLPNGIIKDVEILEGEIELFDPINVKDSNHLYIADRQYHHNCSFEGSSYTLVSGEKLASIPLKTPIYSEGNLDIFVKPLKDHSYVMTVDVSRGMHQDFSAFTVIDVTNMPYEVVAVFKDNTISTLEYPHVIYNTLRQYNNAYVLIEINDLGEEVANTIHCDYEYENIYYTAQNKISQVRGYPGLRTTSKVKQLGCSVMKDLIEKDQLIINSFKIIQELGVFVKNRKTYAATDRSINDDLCATLWFFGWLTAQDAFEEATNTSLRRVIAEKNNAYVEESLTPFGFYQDNKPADLAKETLMHSELPSSDSPNFLTSEQVSLLKG